MIIYFKLNIMYKINEITSMWIPKSQIYSCINLWLPISHKIIRNYRVFNENDIEIFQFYNKYWDLKAIEKYWIQKNIKENYGGVQEQGREDNLKNEMNNIDDIIQDKIKNVIQEHENEKKKLNDLISIKNDKLNEYALLKQEEKREKDEFIKKYDEQRNKNETLLKKYYNLKSYFLLVLSLLIIIIIVWVFVYINNFK